VLDAYNRHARLAPALLTLLPLTGLLGLLEWSLVSLSRAVPVIVAAGLHVLAVHVVSDLGRAKQETLWREWDGPPTTHMLRWREATNIPALEQRHRDVTRVTGQPLPTQSEEASNTVSADLRYEAAAARILGAARGNGFELVATQNAAYGFRRNMLGCRNWAIGCSVIAVLGAVTCGVLGKTAWPIVSAFSAAVTIWTVSLCLMVNPGFVRKAADRYAEALLGAAHRLP
jgi:hypothetical protein